MPNLRRAGVGDAAELTRLRALMFVEMGVEVSAPGWTQACERALVRRLADVDRFAAWLVEADGRAVSTGVGWVEEHLPSPGRPDGRRGHVASMSTDPAWRRQGHARSVLEALLAWLDEAGVPRVDLRATSDGRGLYEHAGFRPLGGPSLSRLSQP